jgi:hypothetical protein
MYFRTINRLYAAVFGYFWLPCPECGQEFGGHEWKYGFSSNKEGKGICPDCTKAGKGHDFMQDFQQAMQELRNL